MRIPVGDSPPSLQMPFQRQSQAISLYARQLFLWRIVRGKAFDNKVPVLEDFITSRITEKGFSVISREVVIDSLKNYSSEKQKVLMVKH